MFALDRRRRHAICHGALACQKLIDSGRRRPPRDVRASSTIAPTRDEVVGAETRSRTSSWHLTGDVESSEPMLGRAQGERPMLRRW